MSKNDRGEKEIFGRTFGSDQSPSSERKCLALRERGRWCEYDICSYLNRLAVDRKDEARRNMMRFRVIYGSIDPRRYWRITHHSLLMSVITIEKCAAVDDGIPCAARKGDIIIQSRGMRQLYILYRRLLSMYILSYNITLVYLF